jgi:hypothetical protein
MNLLLNGGNFLTRRNVMRLSFLAYLLVAVAITFAVYVDETSRAALDAVLSVAPRPPVAVAQPTGQSIPEPARR